MERIKTRYIGVYERKSSVRRYQGKPDVAFDIFYRDKDGRQHIHCAGWRSDGMTAAEASSLRAEIIKKAKQRVKEKLTFGRAWELYRDDWLEANKKACLKSDISLYSNYLRPQLAILRLEEVTPVHINAILTCMSGRALQTKKHALGLINRIYRKMIGWKLYSGDIPTRDMIPGRIDNERIRYLTPAEAKTLLEAMDNHSPPFADICRVSLYAGLRLREIFNLQVQHVHLDTGLLDIMDAKAGSRQAIIGDVLAPVLTRHIKGKRAGEYVFTQSDGKSQLRNINQTFFRVVKALGLNDGVTDARQKVVFHTLRHTFASWLVQKGVPLYTVADLMGHSTISMTKRYAKLAQDDRRTAIASLNGII